MLISVTKLGERGVPLLIRALDGGNPEAHKQIVQSIASLGKRARAAIPALRAIADGPRKDLRATAAEALQKIGTAP